MKNGIIKDIEVYNSIKSKAITAFEEDKFEKSLDYIRTAALMAWQCHCGIWYDDELEILLMSIALSLKNENIAWKFGTDEFGQGTGEKIAYVTSAVNIGGLTIHLNNWINLLKNDFKEKTVYVTNSYTSKKPFYCKNNTFNDPELRFYNLSHQKKYADRIMELVNFLNRNAPDYIVMFVDPDDVIAVSAISALDIHPKIIYANHMDHSFWLGKNILDDLACFRNEGALHAKQCRDLNNSFIVPISTNIKPQKTFSKEDFGIGKDSTVSISIGTFPKVLGNKNPNYFHTITSLLEKFPDHYHFFITNPPDKLVLEKYLPDNPDVKRRFIIDGPFSYLSPYYEIADFLIETFPITGYAVQVEAMAFKLPIVAFENKFPLFSSAGNLYSYPFVAATENDIINLGGKLIKNPRLRLKIGNILYNHYIKKLNPNQTYSSLKDLINDKPQNLNLENDAVCSSYDIKDVKMFTCRNFTPYKQLILQSVLKKSSFSIKERFKFYYNALKMKEFHSKKEEMLGYLIPVISGRNTF